MKTIFNFIIASLIVLISLVALAAAVLWYKGDWILEAFRPAIESQLSSRLKGKVSWVSLRAKIFPRTDLVVEGLTFTPQESCADIRLGSATLSLDPYGLLEKKLAVDSIELVKPELQLKVEQGKLALAALADSTCQSAAAPSIPALPPQDAQPVSPTVDSPATSRSFHLKKLGITDAGITLLTKGKTYRIHVASFSTRADLEGGILNLANVSLDARIDKSVLKINSGALQAGLADGSFQIDRLSGSLNGQKILASGKFNGPSSAAEMQLESPGVSVPALPELSALLTPRAGFMRSAVLSGKLRIKASGPADWSLDGSLDARNIEVSPLSHQFGELSINSLSLASKDGEIRASFKPYLTGLSLRDNQDYYFLGKASGALFITRKKDASLAVTGELNVENFSFDDGETKIERASAELKRIVASITSRGDVRVTFDTQGKSVLLTHPEIRITELGSVSAPIVVEVPAKGGYSVSGPVSTAGVVLDTNGFVFSGVGGKIDMLISGPLKRFTTASLSATSQSRRLSVGTEFSMTKERYSWRKTSLGIGQGRLISEAALERNEGKAYWAKVSATDVLVSDLFSVLRQKEEESYSGRLRSLKISVGGSFKDPLGSMTGSGEVALMDPLLKNYNMTRALTNAISKIPLVGTTLVPGEDTEAKPRAAGEGVFTIKQRSLHFSKLIGRRNRYTINAQGKIGFDQSVDLRADVVFLADSFRSLGLGFDALGSLLSRAGRISIPVFITGSLSNPSITPDIQKLAADNSGLTLVGSALSSSVKAGAAVGRTILSPLRVFGPSATPTATPESPFLAVP